MQSQWPAQSLAWGGSLRLPKVLAPFGPLFPQNAGFRFPKRGWARPTLSTKSAGHAIRHLFCQAAFGGAAGHLQLLALLLELLPPLALGRAAVRLVGKFWYDPPAGRGKHRSGVTVVDPFLFHDILSLFRDILPMCVQPPRGWVDFAMIKGSKATRRRLTAKPVSFGSLCLFRTQDYLLANVFVPLNPIMKFW